MEYTLEAELRKEINKLGENVQILINKLDKRTSSLENNLEQLHNYVVAQLGSYENRITNIVNMIDQVNFRFAFQQVVVCPIEDNKVTAYKLMFSIEEARRFNNETPERIYDLMIGKELYVQGKDKYLYLTVDAATNIHNNKDLIPKNFFKIEGEDPEAFFI